MNRIKTTSIDKKEKFYGIKERAELLNVSVSTINGASVKKIHASRFGGRIFCAHDELKSSQQQCLDGINIAK